MTVNAEPRGSVELGWLPTLDLRAGRFFNVKGSRLELSVDVYNATNANTVFGVRTNTGLATIRVDGDPAAPPTPDHGVPLADAAARAARDPLQRVVRVRAEIGRVGVRGSGFGVRESRTPTPEP